MLLPQSGQIDLFKKIISTIFPLLIKLWRFWRKTRKRNGEGKIPVSLENLGPGMEHHLIPVLCFSREVHIADFSLTGLVDNMLFCS